MLLESGFDPITSILSFDTTIISGCNKRTHPTQKIRIYTLKELIDIGKDAGFKLVDVFGNSTESRIEENKFEHKSEEMIPLFRFA